MPNSAESERPLRPPPPWLLPAMVGALLICSALLAVALTSRPAAFSAQPAVEAPVAPAAPAAEAPVEAPAQAPPETHGGLDPAGPQVEQISLGDARARFDAGSAIFIDLRAGSAYAEGHIPGALTITSQELETRLKELPEGAVIIAYGDAERPESGQRGAQIFMELGYPQVIALEGGFQAWRDAGNPVAVAS